MIKTKLPHTTSDFSVEDELKSHIKKLAQKLKSSEGIASLKKAAEDSIKRVEKSRKDCTITDPMFFYQKVTI